jgi:hypothetical protein
MFFAADLEGFDPTLALITGMLSAEGEYVSFPDAVCPYRSSGKLKVGDRVCVCGAVGFYVTLSRADA